MVGLQALIAGAILIGCLAICGTASATAVAPSDTPLDGYVTNGVVNSVVQSQSGNTTYLGGQFSEVGPRTGDFAAVSSSAAAYEAAATPQVYGTVDAVAPDGSGGWYIGGTFTAVGGVAISNAAHINADGTLDTGWNPSPEGQVTSIAVSADGSTVYLGGYLTAVQSSASATVTRQYLAAVSASTGFATSWNPNPNSAVEAITVSGTNVYVGGYFSSIGGGNQDYVAAVDATSGDLDTAWEPTLNNYVDAIAVSSDGSSVYVGGGFTSVDSSTRNGAAAVDGVAAADNATLTGWNPIAEFGTVQAIALSPDGSTVYLGGAGMDGIVGSPPQLGDVYATAVGAVGAAVDPGTYIGWNPDPNGTVESISVSPDGSTVYLGGVFSKVLSPAATYVTRNDAAAVSATAGTDYGDATAWDPEPDNAVQAIAATGSSVFMGGEFNSVNTVGREDLAAIDDTSGAATSWNPGAENEGNTGSPSVDTLALSPDGSTLYVGGNFNELGGVGAVYAGAVSTSTGANTGWDPSFYPDASGVSAIAVSGSAVYVAGGFTTENYDRGNAATFISGLAAFDPTTGTVDAGFNPAPGNAVLTLAVSGSTVYAGGYFTTIGGASQSYAAALDASSGALQSWNPDPNNVVQSIAVSPDGSTVYLSGYFQQLGSTARQYVGAVDAEGSADSGQVTAWNPDPNGGVTGISVAPDDSAVYLAGDFSSVNSSSGAVDRNFVADTDPTTGDALAWDPPIGSAVNAIAAGATAVAVGSESSEVGNLPQANIAIFPLVANVSPPGDPTAGFSFAQSSTSLAVNFTDASTAVSPATLTGWSWEFGDGTSSTSQSPSHTYASLGSYQVTLKVTDSDGNTGTVTQTVVVNAPPTAAFTSAQSSKSLAMQFTDTSTAVSPATLTGWSWSFGDGTSSTSESPTHTYASPGSYQVTLEVTDSNGNSGTVTRTVVVNAPPTAAFTSAQSSKSLAMQFTDTSTVASPATITGWDWSFGDGGSSTAENPAHTYASAGSYPVTLTVTDSNGETATKTATVTVNKITVTPPIAPVISQLTQSAKSWREGSALTKITQSRRRVPAKITKAPVGTTFTLKLSEAATVKLVFTDKGITVGGKCELPSKKHKHGKSCTLTAGTLTFSGAAGTNKVKFDGRISKTKKLAAGSYTLTATATANKLTSKTKTAVFRIVT